MPDPNLDELYDEAREYGQNAMDSASGAISTISKCFSVYGAAAEAFVKLTEMFFGGPDPVQKALDDIKHDLTEIKNKLNEILNQLFGTEGRDYHQKLDAEVSIFIDAGITDTNDYLRNPDDPGAIRQFEDQFDALQQQLQLMQYDSYFVRGYHDALAFSTYPYAYAGRKFVPPAHGSPGTEPATGSNVWFYLPALQVFMRGLVVLAMMYSVEVARKPAHDWGAINDLIEGFATRLQEIHNIILAGFVEFPRPYLRHMAYRIERKVFGSGSTLIPEQDILTRACDPTWRYVSRPPATNVSYIYRTVLDPGNAHSGVPDPIEGLGNSWTLLVGMEHMERPYGVVEIYSKSACVDSYPSFPVPNPPTLKDLRKTSWFDSALPAPRETPDDVFFDDEAWGRYYAVAVQRWTLFCKWHRIRTRRQKMKLYRELGLSAVWQASADLHHLIGRQLPNWTASRDVIEWSLREVGEWCCPAEGAISCQKIGVSLGVGKTYSLRATLES